MVSPTPEELEPSVRAARVEALYRDGVGPLVTSLINASLLCLVLRGMVSSVHAFYWWTAMGVITAARVVAYWPYRNKKITPVEAPAAGRRYLAGALLNGLGWGASSFVLYPEHELAGQVLVAFVLGGMTAGAAAMYAADPPTYRAYAVTSMVPLIVQFAMGGDEVHWVMGVMLVVFGLAMSTVNVRGFVAMRDAMRLRLSNLVLLDRVSAAQAQTEELNRDLEKRVQQRTAELEATTAELAQAGYLARLGSLAAGLAHEINNPLSYVTSNLSFLERTLRTAPALAADTQKELLEVIAEALEGAARVRSTVGHLKAMAQPEEDALGPVDLNEVLESCLAVTRAEIKRRAQLDTRLGAIPPVEGKRRGLSQVFLSLVLNALEALPAEGMGQNKLELSSSFDATAKEVRVDIRDNGPSISPQLQSALFEPWSAGRSGQPGTGLGLAMCHSIVGDLGGRITFETEPGKGTTFSVFLRPTAEAET